MIRAVVALLVFAATGSAWVESVEFPWSTFPPHLCERELVWLKNIGIRHVSLAPGGDPARLREVINIIRRLDIEADLEGPVPDDLQPLTRAHGGPLTEPLPAGTARINALESETLLRERRAIDRHAPAILWSDVEDTIGPSGFKPGAVNFTGEEKPATIPLRRGAQLAAYWGAKFGEMRATPGARVAVASGTKAPALISVAEFSSPERASAVSVVNESKTDWTGDVKAVEHGGKSLVIPGVTIPAHGAAMLPVHVPLVSGPFCKGCTGLAPSDYLVYATAELTTIEYENGIIAMEFSAPSAGEVVLQLDREPHGPLVAGGKPASFDWDEHAMRAKLPIPAGKDPGNHVRIGLAIEAPDHTGYFENARMLLIGETNRLIAQFSSKEIAGRSRLHIDPELPVTRKLLPIPDPATEPADANDPIRAEYDVTVPATAVHGDHAELVLEADAIQMSHVRPQLLRPAAIRFGDAIEVRLSAASSYPLYPSIIAVNERTGRDVAVAIRNNAPEIRTFNLAISAEGLEFSPATMEVSVGASTSREVSFRVFPNQARAGLHAGKVTLSGAATAVEPFRMAVIPGSGETAWTADGFFFLESTAARASFLPGAWLEYVAKEQGEERLPQPVAPFSPGPISVNGDALLLAGGRTIRLSDLERMLPRKAQARTQPRGRP